MRGWVLLAVSFPGSDPADCFSQPQSAVSGNQTGRPATVTRPRTTAAPFPNLTKLCGDPTPGPAAGLLGSRGGGEASLLQLPPCLPQEFPAHSGSPGEGEEGH